MIFRKLLNTTVVMIFIISFTMTVSVFSEESEEHKSLSGLSSEESGLPENFKPTALLWRFHKNEIGAGILNLGANDVTIFYEGKKKVIDGNQGIKLFKYDIFVKGNEELIPAAFKLQQLNSYTRKLGWCYGEIVGELIITLALLTLTGIAGRPLIPKLTNWLRKYDRTYRILLLLRNAGLAYNALGIFALIILPLGLGYYLFNKEPLSLLNMLRGFTVAGRIPVVIVFIILIIRWFKWLVASRKSQGNQISNI